MKTTCRIQVKKCSLNKYTNLPYVFGLASAAQLDARLTGDQEAVGWIPTGLATFFCGDLIMKYFLPSKSVVR